MAIPKRILSVALQVAADVGVAAGLLLYSDDRSFASGPFPTFYVAIAAFALAAAAGFVFLSRQGQSSNRPRTWLPRAVPTAHVVIGAVSFFVGLFGFSFFLICADPGGCFAEFLPFWPLMGPGILLATVGLLALALGPGVRPPAARDAGA